MKFSKAGYHLFFVGVISWLLITLWAYAAVSKWLDFHVFRVQLNQSILITNFSGFLVWFIPALELMLAALLIFDSTRWIGLLGSFTLILMFSFYIILVTRVMDDTPCSCGGILEKMNWNQHLIFNGLVTFCTLAAFLMNGLFSNDISLQQIRGNRKPVEQSR